MNSAHAVLLGFDLPCNQQIHGEGWGGGRSSPAVPCMVWGIRGSESEGEEIEGIQRLRAKCGAHSTSPLKGTRQSEPKSLKNQPASFQSSAKSVQSPCLAFNVKPTVSTQINGRIVN